MRRALIAIALGSAVAGTVPAVAAAHAIITTEDDTLVYRSPDATSQNQLRVTPAGDRLLFRDPTVDGGMDYGQCLPGSVNASGFAVEARCATTGIRALRIELFDREDTAQVQVPYPVTMTGGDGADRLTSGPDDDTVDGGRGVDVLDAGAGDDELRSADGLADELRCGAGIDTAVADTADQVASDCENVSRAVITPDAQPGAGDVTPPGLRVRATSRQRPPRLRIRATADEAATMVAAGSLRAAGGAAVAIRSVRRRVAAGRAVMLTVTLRGSALRSARRALARKRRVTASLSVVATDAAGNSRQVRVRAIVLR